VNRVGFYHAPKVVKCNPTKTLVEPGEWECKIMSYCLVISS